MAGKTLDISAKRHKINIFKIGRLWCFKYFFKDNEIFKELSGSYNQDNYRFELATVEVKSKIMEYLEGKGFELTLIEDPSDYTVKIDRFKTLTPSE
jgi:hypothetical protein